jgi:hypothetical protein
MATKAERERARMQREAKPDKKPRVRKSDGPATADKKAHGKHTAVRNVTKHVDSRGGAALEDSATGKPSRRSTRKSSGHVKRASNLTRRQVRRNSAPKTRATRAQAKRK